MYCLRLRKSRRALLCGVQGLNCNQMWRCACMSNSKFHQIYRHFRDIGHILEGQQGLLKSVRVHFAYGSDGRSFSVEYS